MRVRSDPDDPPSDGQVILDKGDVACDASGAGYALVVDGDYVAVEYLDRNVNIRRTRAATSQDIALPSLWDGDWHHITIGSDTGANGGGWTGFIVDGWWIGTGPPGNMDGIDLWRLADRSAGDRWYR